MLIPILIAVGLAFAAKKASEVKPAAKPLTSTTPLVKRPEVARLVAAKAKSGDAATVAKLAVAVKAAGDPKGAAALNKLALAKAKATISSLPFFGGLRLTQPKATIAVSGDIPWRLRRR